MQAQISVTKCQILTLDGGQNDDDYVFDLSVNDIPNARHIRGLNLPITSSDFIRTA